MRLRLLTLALGTFAVGTDSMVMAGLLGQIARDMDISVTAAGQLVTVFALSYGLLAPVLATATARWPRRRLLLTALAVFTLGNALSAVAPTYAFLLATRVLAAAGAALYTPTANGVAASIVPPERRGRALATVIGGMTVATALGVPLGTYIGSTDWRLAMWLVVGLGVLAFAGLSALLRELPAPTAAPGLRERLAPLGNGRVLGAVSTTFLFFLAFQSVYIFLATALRPATGGDSGSLSLILLVIGVASVTGNWLGGRVVDRLGVRPVLLASSASIVVLFVALPWLSQSMGGAFVYGAASALLGWPVSVALAHRMSSIDPANASLLLSLNSSGMYLGMAAAGAAGSAEIALLGERWFPLAASGLAVVTFVVAAATTRRRSRSGAQLVASGRTSAATADSGHAATDASRI